MTRRTPINAEVLRETLAGAGIPRIVQTDRGNARLAADIAAQVAAAVAATPDPKLTNEQRATLEFLKTHGNAAEMCEYVELLMGVVESGGALRALDQFKAMFVKCAQKLCYDAEHHSEEKPDRNAHVAQPIRDVINAFSQPLVKLGPGGDFTREVQG